MHGAFVDGSMWTGVIAGLQAAGVAVIALANPLRGLASDAAYIASAAAEIDGPVILAGHCYGGAVITAAGAAVGNAVGLVYVTGFALDEGESAFDIAGRFPGSRLAPSLRPATFCGINGDTDVELYIDREAFPHVFAADLTGCTATAAAASQRPITAAAFEEKQRAAAWKQIPCWYVIATTDLLIPVEAQRFMAQRAGAEIHASHAIAQAEPAASPGRLPPLRRPCARRGPTSAAGPEKSDDPWHSPAK